LRVKASAKSHVAIGVVVCIVVPLLSRVFGGEIGYTMFAGTTAYELRIRKDGTPISTTDVRARAGGTFATFLVDGRHRVRSTTALRAHLDDVAMLACSSGSNIEVMLVEDLDTGERRTTSAERSCR
jgi:hypothetical protein